MRIKKQRRLFFNPPSEIRIPHFNAARVVFSLAGRRFRPLKGAAPESSLPRHTARYRLSLLFRRAGVKVQTLIRDV
jgi:hypothetical protein